MKSDYITIVFFNFFNNCILRLYHKFRFHSRMSDSKKQINNSKFDIHVPLSNNVKYTVSPWKYKQ